MNGKRSSRALVLLLALALPAAALYVGCSGPFGLLDDPQARSVEQDVAAGGGARVLNALQSDLEITKSAAPAEIYLQGLGLGNEVTTVTIQVTGYGGTVTTAMPLDIVFAIDSSGSMGVPTNPQTGSDPTGLRMTAAKDFVDRLDPAVDRAAVVSWDNDIDFTYPSTAPYPSPGSMYTPPGPPLSVSDTLTNDFAELKNQIDAVDANGGTNITLGLLQSVRMLDADPRPESAPAVIFLTDGVDTSGWPSSLLNTWVNYAASQGYRIYTIGLGSNVNPSRLQMMAGQTGGQYYEAPTAENLQDLYDQIYTEVVSSTAPSAVDVVEVTREYIVEEGSFSITPDSVVTDPGTGQTTITWLDVGRYVGNLNSRLASDETFSVSFAAKSSQDGADLPVDAEAAAVNFLDPGGTAQSRPIPQAFITVIGKILVSIDIKPGSDPNSINAKNDNGVIPVAILSTEAFDARSVDHTSVTFEGASEAHVDKKSGVARRHEEDVDGDGDIDLVFHFRHEETSLSSASTEGVLQGLTYGGVPIEGSDTVRMLH